MPLKNAIESMLLSQIKFTYIELRFGLSVETLA